MNLVYEFYYLKVISEQRDGFDSETEFFIRTKSDIDDFLFEMETSYARREAARLFDHVDIIFVVGDSYLLPWSPIANKVR